VQLAGTVGRYFRIDPVVVLNSNYWEWACRVAALNYAASEEKKANQKNSRTTDSRISHLM
jgi:hypothetical protein